MTQQKYRYACLHYTDIPKEDVNKAQRNFKRWLSKAYIDGECHFFEIDNKIAVAADFGENIDSKDIKSFSYRGYEPNSITYYNTKEQYNSALKLLIGQEAEQYTTSNPLTSLLECSSLAIQEGKNKDDQLRDWLVKKSNGMVSSDNKHKNTLVISENALYLILMILVMLVAICIIPGALKKIRELFKMLFGSLNHINNLRLLFR